MITNILFMCLYDVVMKFKKIKYTLVHPNMTKCVVYLYSFSNCLFVCAILKGSILIIIMSFSFFEYSLETLVL